MDNKEAERIIKMQEERYKLLMMYTHAMMFDYDVEKDMLSYIVPNDDGIPEEHLIENYVSKIALGSRVDMEFIPDYIAAMKEASSKKVKGEFEFRANLLNKGSQWYRAYYISVTDEQDGKVYHIIGRVQDIEDEIEEKERLRGEMVKLDHQTGFYHYEYAKKVLENYLESEPQAGTCCMLVIQVAGFEEMASHDGSLVEDAVFINIVEAIRRNTDPDSDFVRSGSMQFMIFNKQRTKMHEERVAEQIASEIAAMHIEEPGDLPLRIMTGSCTNEVGNNFSRMYHQCLINME